MKLYGSSEMARIDEKATDELGIPSSLLMENAGRATVNYIRHQLGSAKHCYAPIFVGPGNNGGDGLVVGRHLFQHGCTPLFFIIATQEQLGPESLLSLSIIKKLALPHCFVTKDIYKSYQEMCAPFTGRRCYALIDALLGVGLRREVKEIFADTIALMNSEKTRQKKGFTPSLVSCDIASGIDANTGIGRGAWVQADFTASYSHAKAGQLQADGKEASGVVKILDIGIPQTISQTVPPLFVAIDQELCATTLRNSSRANSSHKGSHGHICIIGGSTGMAGAALLTGKASLKMGSGLTTIAVPGALRLVFESQLHEAMTISLGDQNDHILQETHLPQIIEAMGAKDIIAMGPGLGSDKQTCSVLRHIYHNSSKVMVIDADAINALASVRETLISPKGPRVFTPHPGEMARLLGISTAEIQQDRRAAVQKFISLFDNCRHEIVVVLKGEASLIATTGSQSIYLNSSGNPGMATGGMGDVLTGIIASLLGQGLSLKNAAIAGTYLHGMAADQLANTSDVGFTASEVATALPLCRKKLQESPHNGNVPSFL